jgi:hypothetical protein
MKKLVICSCILLLLVVCLTGCDFFANLEDSLKNPESLPKTEEMITALADNRMDDAKALMHPSSAEGSDISLSVLAAFLDGRKPTSVRHSSININSSFDIVGNKQLTEEVEYDVVLTDGSTIVATVVYLSNAEGTGFTSFSLSIGA